MKTLFVMLTERNLLKDDHPFILSYFIELYYTSPHDSGGVLWYTLRCLSVRKSARTSFPDNSSYRVSCIALKPIGQLVHELVHRILFRVYSTPNFDRVITPFNDFSDLTLLPDSLLQFSSDTIETWWTVRLCDAAHIVLRLQYTKHW